MAIRSCFKCRLIPRGWLNVAARAQVDSAADCGHEFAFKVGDVYSVVDSISRRRRVGPQRDASVADAVKLPPAWRPFDKAKKRPLSRTSSPHGNRVKVESVFLDPADYSPLK